MVTAEGMAAESIMETTAETQTDPALMLEAQPGEGKGFSKYLCKYSVIYAADITDKPCPNAVGPA